MTERPLTLMSEQYQLDKSFYDELSSRRSRFQLVESSLVEPFTGKGFKVPRGHSFRIVLVEGPQIADVGLWGAHDPTIGLSSRRTQLAEGWSVRPYSRLWSDVPPLCPLATCIRDTVGEAEPNSGYQHHYVGTHCTPEWIESRGGGPGKNACRVNLLQAVEEFGMHEGHIRDNINVHMKTRIGSDGQTYAVRSGGKPGDYLELYAEIDLIVGVSVCPSGDNTRYYSDPDDGFVKPLKVEIYDTQTQPLPSPVWHDWRRDWSGKWRPNEA